VLTYMAQDMMWNCVDTALVHELPRLQATAEHYFDRKEKLGRLTLDPALPLPANIAKTEIHRQPGGFCFEAHDRDITSGARYNGGGMMYSAGKGRSAVAGRSGGDFVVETVRSRYPDFTPKRILEIGCGTGRNTPAYKRLYPDAEVVAVDCAAGLLRWAYATAESEGVAIDFRQMDLTKLAFPDASFDMVVSHIVGHETTHRGLPLMIAESWRVLAPGGVMFHLDVPTQTGFLKLFDQVLNDWQVRYNGEPFWMGWADANVKGLMGEAGVPADAMFAEHLRPPEGGNVWFCHGARKPQSTPARRAA
jgi:SAM-dependent methyltransferase